jgi:iron complex transport system substrate-binding protein
MKNKNDLVLKEVKKMDKKTVIAIFLVVLIASVSAYFVYGEYYASSESPTNPPPQSPAQTVSPTNDPNDNSLDNTSDSSTPGNTGDNLVVSYYPLTVVDDEGTTVVINSAKRIVSLAPSITETIFAAGAGGQVVGVTDYCDYPYNFKEWIAAGNMSSIGGYWQPPIEPIMSVNPDVIFACGDGASNEAAEKLRALNYTVIVLNPTSAKAILGNIELIGKVTNHNDEATEAIRSIQARINAITTKVADITDKPTVAYMLMSTYGAGSGSFIHDLITLAGGINVFSDLTAAYPQVSREAFITRNPDVIVTTSATTTFTNGATYANVNAVINGRVYRTSNGTIYERNGPRFIDALEDIASKIHPELFVNA